MEMLMAMKATLKPLLLFFLTAMILAPMSLAGGKKDLFGIYTATLSGDDVRLLVSDSSRQMTHPRVSPDGEWITFTRYHKKGWLSGLAEEKGGYQQTSILLARIDGTDVQTLIPAKKGILNCNSTWSSDGKFLVWLTTDNPGRQPQLRKIELQTRRISDIPTPPGLNPADPHVVGNRIVFPVVGGNAHYLWVMDLDGSNGKRLTVPNFGKAKKIGKHQLGDYDPKLSPDGSKVAFMRLYGKDGWRIFVVDVNTGKETDLSGPNQIDTLPDWSSDGKLLLFWHIDKKALHKMGLYTMKPDGSDRKMIPLPRGYLHGHPHFFPNRDSSPNARIIYRATKAPQLK
jgi:Tol biopolymer transport system component